MNEVEGGVPGFEPLIRYHTFAESGINFSVILRTREVVGKYLITHEFIRGCRSATAKRASSSRSRFERSASAATGRAPAERGVVPAAARSRHGPA